MQCPRCGADLRGGAELCPACGAPAATDSASQTDTPGITSTRRKVVYAGFWLRAVAYLIDGLLLAIALGPFAAPIMRNNNVGPSPKEIFAFYSGWTRQSTALALLIQLADWLYSATLESSAWQATLGKKIVGLKVTDADGHRLSFARATGRHFGKFLSNILFLGFILAGFTEKKQGLHDLIAGTLVIRKTSLI